ncbi:MAG: hypothetical protein ACFFD4_27530, partial [Candidatus Odinarchaeota archaeon]
MLLGESQPELDGIRINQIWILKDSGLCLFHASFADEDKEVIMDKTTFSGLLAAISSFASEAAKTQIKKITMGNITLHQYKKGNLLICLAAEREIHNETVLSKFFTNTMNEFESDYNPLLSSQVFDITAFESFQTKLLNILKVKFYTKKAPSFEMLFILLNKILDKVITSVITGDKIAVVGDETQTEAIIATLEQFTPHRDLKKIYWTNTEIERADLIGIPRKLENSYTKLGYKILDIKNQGKFKGLSNDFVRKLIKDIKKIDDPSTIAYIIQTRLNYFISRVSTIMDLYKREKVNNEAMEILRK